MSYSEIGLRLVLAILLGGVIGLERASAQKPAGLRTNILVCMGTTMFILIALMAFEEYPQSAVDITRMAAGIITGIGFLGAGTILRTETGVQGLTSAATIWLVCGIGMAIGLGYYFLAAAGAFLGFVVLRLLPFLEARFK
ncbi:MAG TPA: MgtC/SapB family protein [Candidatus Binatia bacterium]|jgi:putative Mg2+ transporter-C (MgtC) family protein